ncbi:hypothetical protein GGI07_002712 [Coemansia sp. Benny D115]|nr:hypothetical protein GGI07_002712 [Coemansia sp. Benny D115]
MTTTNEAFGVLDSVQYFLDGNFTALESLETVDELLRDAESTHVLLKDELHTAHEQVELLSKEATTIIESMRRESLKLIDMHSEVVGTSADEEVSAWQFRDDTDVMKLMAKLAEELQTYERLNCAKEYVGVVVQIEQVKAQAGQSPLGNPQGALSACAQAIDILSEHCADPQGSKSSSDSDSSRSEPSSNLQNYVKEVVQQVFDKVEETTASAQMEALKQLGWPGKIDISSSSAVVAFDSSFATLLSLERIMRDSHETLARSGMDLLRGRTFPLPLIHMARSVDIRMRYHFESARETNRADKPEWWLSHILTLLRNVMPFLETHVQWLYSGTGTDGLDTRDFITLLLPVVSRKLAHDRQDYLSSGMTIAKVVKELSNFEHTLQEVYFFDGPSVLSEFLADDVLFAAWVEAERTSAMQSYTETVSKPDAFEPVYQDDMLEADDARPTCLAEKVVLIIDDIADRYSVVPSCMLQLQLLSTAQFPVIIAMVEDIEAEIDEFSRISLAFIRDATSMATASATAPSAKSTLLAQLGRLASWYHTVWYVEEAARDWNNSTVYVNMWAAVCRRARALGSTDDPRDWREDCDNWNAKDKELLDSQTGLNAGDVGSEGADDWLDGGIWERTIDTLGGLKKRVLELISKAVNKDVIGQLRAYRKKSWTAASPNASPTLDTEYSAELAPVLTELSQTLSSLAGMLPHTAYLRITRRLAEELDTFLVDRVACAHLFDILGGRQFAKDTGAFGQVLYGSSIRTAFKATVQRNLLRARECAMVLSCSVDSSLDSGSSSGGMELSLEEWSPAIMQSASDSQEAALMLEKLGIRHLSVKQVQQLVRNRTDFNRDNALGTP